MENSWRAHGPRSAAPAGHALRAYGLAIVTTLLGAAVTRVTWPFFAGAPFAPLFAAVAATSHWGSGPAGLVTVALATLIAPLAFLALVAASRALQPARRGLGRAGLNHTEPAFV